MTLSAGGNNASTTFSGISSGAGGLTKAGSGALALTGSNNFGGTMTVDGGTVQLLSGSLFCRYQTIGSAGAGTLFQSGGTSSLYYTNELTLGKNPGSSGTYLLSGGLFSTNNAFEFIGFAGTGIFTQSGGTNSSGNQLFLAWNGGSSGVYNLNGGLLLLSGYGVTSGSGGAAFNFGGGTLGQRPWSSALNMNLTGAGGNSVVNTSGGSISLSGVLSGTGGLTKIGTGMLTLTGPNTYSGNTTVDGGTLQLSAGQLASSAQTVGYSLGGSFAQSGGTNAAANSLCLGYSAGASGNYNLSNGSLSAANETIGCSGTGTFTQSGGTNSAGSLTVQFNSTSSGTYNLSGSGLLSVQQSEYVGNAGTGSFTQSGGTHSVANCLYLGYSGSSNGTYSLSGSGRLAAPIEYLGYSGTGTFTQSGGTNAVSLLQVGTAAGTGAYLLSGNGVLSTSAARIDYGGTFTQSGGINSVTGSLVLGQSAGSAGTYNLNGGLLLLSAAGIAQGSGSATFNFGGGTFGASAPWSSPLNMNLTGAGGPAAVDTTGGNIGLSGVLSGTGGLTKTGNGTLTLTASNGFSGGATIGSGVLAVNSDAALGATSGPVSFNGNGTLQAGTAAVNLVAARAIVIADGATATFDTNGNAINVAGAIGGNGGLQKVGSGTLTLTGLNTYSGNTTVDGGTLQIPSGRLSSPTQYVGFSAAGSFTQSGGTNTIASGLYVGDGLGSSGSYGLSGSGLLSAANEYAGLGGSGAFTQSGGTNTVWNRLQVGTVSGTGAYALSGSGLLFASPVDIDFGGIFTQSGGTVSGSISLAVSPSSSGTYNLGGNGVIAASTLSVGQAGAAAFTQAGGTNAANLLYLGQSLSGSGSYSLSGGSLSSTSEFLGKLGLGTSCRREGPTRPRRFTLAALPGRALCPERQRPAEFAVPVPGLRRQRQFHPVERDESGGRHSLSRLPIGRSRGLWPQRQRPLVGGKALPGLLGQQHFHAIGRNECRVRRQ